MKSGAAQRLEHCGTARRGPCQCKITSGNNSSSPCMAAVMAYQAVSQAMGTSPVWNRA
ncbi:MAG TPA: hypothetical protein PKM06_03865 [Bacillota bacterium]|nr:hypothetical protein [Peptococcaceae bacterium MAG4]NLW37216.1 hypothetical protein [Peptococcaceae bacterium]HQD75514.1 hypothetical protein [Bacillota bacterium]HUM58345.1 hypothetical protein [Bacillota bacterium]